MITISVSDHCPVAQHDTRGLFTIRPINEVPGFLVSHLSPGSAQQPNNPNCGSNVHPTVTLTEPQPAFEVSRLWNQSSASLQPQMLPEPRADCSCIATSQHEPKNKAELASNDELELGNSKSLLNG